jgi:hypothetical protein
MDEDIIASLVDKVDSLREDVERVQRGMSGIVQGMETTRRYDSIVSDLAEKNRLLEQRVNHLDTLGTPSWYEQQFNELRDIVYTERNKWAEELEGIKKLREAGSFQVVSFEEMVDAYKRSNIPLGVLSEMVNIELSGLSKRLSGQRKRDDFELYRKIKQACLEYAAAQ